jgi:hypothetical protein
MTTKAIIIDGKEYGSVDEMPPEVRAAYEQKLAQRRRRGARGELLRPTEIIFHGKRYPHWQAIPADIRPVYEAIAHAVSKKQDSIADFDLGEDSWQGKLLAARAADEILLLFPDPQKEAHLEKVRLLRSLILCLLVVATILLGCEILFRKTGVSAAHPAGDVRSADAR